MALSLASYAQQLIVAADAIDAAAGPDEAMTALARFQDLADDPESQRLLATSFLLLVETLPESA